MADIKLSILIPVRNEGVDIKIMLKILQAIIEVPYEILVIYDFSEDDTVSVVQNHAAQFNQVRLIHNTLGAGVVNAIRAGVRQAQGEYILLFAADEVGPVLAIQDMLYLLDSGCDFVSCTRYAHGGRRLGGSLIGGMLSRLANKLFGLLSSCVFSDATTGIKMFRRDIFEKISLESRPIGWAFVFELAIKAQLVGMRLGEVPVISIDRLYGGQSSFALGPWVKEYLRWFLWGLRKLPGTKKAPVALRIPQATL